MISSLEVYITCGIREYICPISKFTEVVNAQVLFSGEILLCTAEEGFCTEVMEIFGVPIKQCSEEMCLSLVQLEVSHEAHDNS